MVSRLVTFGDLCRSQIDMHTVVLAGKSSDVKVRETVQLQLESERWFQVTIVSILCKLNNTNTVL